LQLNEALYAYHFAQASWSGAKICYFERSYESPAILYLLLKGFQKGAKETVETVKGKVEEEAVNQILVYLSAVIDNAGNYKSFGDSKFIPECSEEDFRKFFLSTPYWSVHAEDFEKIYSRIGKMIFNAETPYALINFVDKNGTSGYYSKNITSFEAEKVKDITIGKGLKSENNRLTKQSETEFTIKIASIDSREETIEQNGLKLKLKYGEFAPFLKDLNDHLSQAQKYAANEHQAKMIDSYL
jgi:dipeptidyl-peptidase III